ncbi:similar to Saccharomyces cerevisiae YLR166C SEC10 Essential 100kDa subunit of the exocyst complex [Maudiozyma barnettii]|uniref:Similar to Saccharomyces cerevisiae YLR166C SEC10 Essential 100kDa subunit of the exocyst complex n=1 Tax=Maudiozyma barnettii TaxID=61262 RepID=A0A8H2VFR8_9SACH|nr:exocyst subunit SEC10 [Kazachstania barnettii]CAB4254794.1 similar to Saccharomyces cerevisiae YLR166C SEC10 Essential 100kDa subunit of the exocyst complex [Kazachstania barnettii]CAD1782951.1 similar to Saccharomyces cerevisiae YLR166C SEC10 Essential 100kDa subunit of the exocyst complex [Kazachstania barnettii]
MNSLYELDPKWQKLLTLDNFLGGLTVNEFVESLSKDHSIKAVSSSLSYGQSGSRDDGMQLQDEHDAANWERLDPKPFIRTFESTLKELKGLNDDAVSKKNRFEDQVARQELVHSENVIDLATDIQRINIQFSELDNKLTNVNQIVSPLSDKLESTIRKRKNYVKSVELITEYSNFYTTGSSTNIENLRTSKNWRNKIQAATYIKNLLELSRKVETTAIPKTSEVTKFIEKYSEMMETTLLENFNSAYRENDFNQLNEIALILNQFNGGINVIQSFINQHAYFINSDEIGLDEQMEIDDQFKKRLMDQNIHTVVYEQNILNMLNDIESVIKNESKIVNGVFEGRASYVMQLFVQRVFVQQIEPKVETLLNNSLSLSNLAYVRTLHGLYSLIGQFVKDLTEFFQILEIDQDTTDSKSVPNALDNNSNSSIITVLEQCSSDMFSRYLYDRARYFDIEKRNLENILVDKTSIFTNEHSKEINSKMLLNKLGKMMEKDEDGNTHYEEFITQTATTSKRKLSQFNEFMKKRFDRLDHLSNLSLTRSNTLSHDRDVGVGRSHLSNSQDTNNRGNDYNNDAMLDNSDPSFNLDTVDSMLKCVVESVARVMELVPNKASEYSLELLDIMFLGTVGNYVEMSLEVAFFRMKQLDIYKLDDFNLSFLSYVTKSTDILNLVSTSIKAIFLPLLSDAPDAKKQVIELTNNNIRKCEISINIIIDEIASVYSAKFSDILAKQNKKDFIPKSQDLLDQDTLPAVEISNLLTSLYSQTSVYLEEKNLKAFLDNIGEELYGLLLAHYSKFQVSSIGGIIVTKDIIGFQTVIEDWRIPNLLEKFATLRELANIFTVQPDLLDSLTKEGHLATLKRDIIQSYIAKREDFNHDNFMTNMKMNLKQYT